MASSGGTGRIGWVVIAAVTAALTVMIGRAGADAPNGSGGNAATFTGSAMIGPLFARGLRRALVHGERRRQPGPAT